MFTVTRALEEALLQHFMYQKLEISYAIYKPFPFFEGLRDKSFITESTYRESLEACSNLVPVSRVVYNILTKLEKTFNLPFLELLFSQINLREYPNLMKIFKSFRSVVSSYGGWNRNTPILLEVPANPAERSSCGTLLPLLPPQRPPLRHPTPAARVSELRASPQHSTRVLAEPSRPAGPAKAFSSSTQEGRTIPEESQEMPSTPLTTGQVSSDNLTSQTKGKEDVQDVSRASSAHGAAVRNDAPEPNDPEEPQEASSTLANKKGKKRKRIVQSAPRKRQQNKSLPQGTTSPAHGTQEKLQVVNQATQMKNDSTRVSKVVTRAQKAKTECAQTSAPEEISDDTSKMKEEKEPREPPSALLKIMQDHLANERKRSLGKSPGEKQNTRKKCSWSSSKRKQKKKLPRGTTSPAHGTQEKLQVVNQATQMKNDSTRVSKVVTRAQKAKTECAQTSGPEENKKKNDVRSSSTRTRRETIPQNKKNKAETVDFVSPELPVTCGEAKGILYTEKMGKGSSEKCIQNEEGVWLTPKEFEIEGKGANSKHWKRHVLCRGQSIEKLMKKGLLLCPPRINLKREWENTDECEVCCKGGSLLCCDTCPRAFHEDCHIPPAEADRSPWSCTFCRMAASPGSQDCHRGSEVLERQMRPEQQLIRDYAEPFREAMWLDLVKERLTEKVYTVAWFVRDMRLIFRNHKTFYKASDLGQVGLDLEATFEKDLKELLSFHDTAEKSSRAPL
ncbi:sp110 nuclear body protein isoform X2 [Rhinolophus sinicus]|uniref:sp110 nuclear body protein isoform X2 n=1 Tax=Rhinolophus sinicus TaxID=89399 RepID=UPI003D79B461